MYITTGNAITIPRGDTADIYVQIVDEATDQPYMLNPSENIRFELFNTRGVDPVVTFTVPNNRQEEDGSFRITLSADDTTRLNGKYKYMIRIVNSDETTVNTVIGLETDAYCRIV